jgi:hypothetical protein
MMILRHNITTKIEDDEDDFTGEVKLVVMVKFNLANDRCLIGAVVTILSLVLVNSYIYGFSRSELIMHGVLVSATLLISTLVCGGLGLALGVWINSLEGLKTSRVHDSFAVKLSVLLALIGFWIGITIDVFIIIIPLPLLYRN